MHQYTSGFSWRFETGAVIAFPFVQTDRGWLHGVGHMVKDHSDSWRGNLLPPHWLLFPMNSNGSFICTIP